MAPLPLTPISLSHRKTEFTNSALWLCCLHGPRHTFHHHHHHPSHPPQPAVVQLLPSQNHSLSRARGLCGWPGHLHTHRPNSHTGQPPGPLHNPHLHGSLQHLHRLSLQHPNACPAHEVHRCRRHLWPPPLPPPNRCRESLHCRHPLHLRRHQPHVPPLPLHPPPRRPQRPALPGLVLCFIRDPSIVKDLRFGPSGIGRLENWVFLWFLENTNIKFILLFYKWIIIRQIIEFIFLSFFLDLFFIVNQTKENNFFSLEFFMDNQTSEKIYITFLTFFFPSIFPSNFLSLAFFGNQT